MIIKSFISKPEIGNIVKVYTPAGNQAKFGRVLGFGIRRRTVTDEQGFLYRQIALLTPVEPRKFTEVDYFFTEDRVRFTSAPAQNHNQINQLCQLQNLESWK